LRLPKVALEEYLLAYSIVYSIAASLTLSFKQGGAAANLKIYDEAHANGKSLA